MFTGLIQEVGKVSRVQRSPHGLVWTIEAPVSAAELKPGDSVNVAGACQTVETIDGASVSGTAIGETLKKTTYARWNVGTRVNLELPLRVGDRLGGHIVSGHVDTVGTVVARQDTAARYALTVSFPSRFARWVVAQGSVTLDGVSLTIAARTADTLTVALIPETVKRTTLGSLRVGDQINVEFDQMIKAAVQAVELMTQTSEGITEETLQQAGW